MFCCFCLSTAAFTYILKLLSKQMKQKKTFIFVNIYRLQLLNNQHFVRKWCDKPNWQLQKYVAADDAIDWWWWWWWYDTFPYNQFHIIFSSYHSCRLGSLIYMLIYRSVYNRFPVHIFSNEETI